MYRPFLLWSGAFAVVLAVSIATIPPAVSAGPLQSALQPFRDPSGAFRTVTTTGRVDDSNPYFESLGTNGRACVTCHQPADGFTITPPHVQQRYDADPYDPIFALVDGATCSSDDTSTPDARRQAFSLLLNKGLIRVSLPVPAGAEFTIVDVDDPYGCASATQPSMYRRPLPASNLRFLTTVMWDGRESAPGRSLEGNLLSQALDATLGHAQAAMNPTPAQLQQIVSLESSLFTAQALDARAGSLNAAGAQGGPALLAQQPFYVGINDPLGQDPTGAPFEPRAFHLFDAFATPHGVDTQYAAAQKAIARGQELFNMRPIHIRGVVGLNDMLKQDDIVGTCTTCHNAPNVGNHSVPLALNIGIGDASRRTPDLPLYTIRCDATGEVVQTSDPGRALITGRCADIGKVKGPVLRGLSSRAPYFHNGSAAALADVIDFYNQRFNLGLSDAEKADLMAFLQAL